VSKADLCRSRDMGDVTKREQEVREQEDTSEVPILDDVPDQPSSPIPTASNESQPSQDDRQEVLGDGSVSTGHSEDREAPSNAERNDRERSTMEENIRVHTSQDTDELANPLDENIPTLQSATIDCRSGNYNVESQPSPGERQRPIRNASRPTRYRDAAFDTQFQPKPCRHRRIRQHDATGNYVTNEGVWFRLGRGVKERRTIHVKNKGVKPDINRRNAQQSPKNNRRRYPRSYAERTPTMALPHAPMNTRNPLDPAKTSKVLQKRLSPAALRSSSTLPPRATSAHSSAATAGVKINKIVINEQPDRCRTTRPTAAAAAARDQPAKALPLQKAKVNSSTNGKTDITSVSVPGKIRITNIDCPTTSTHQNASKVIPQQRSLHLNLADVETSSTSTEPAVSDRIRHRQRKIKIKK